MRTLPRTRRPREPVDEHAPLGGVADPDAFHPPAGHERGRILKVAVERGSVPGEAARARLAQRGGVVEAGQRPCAPAEHAAQARALQRRWVRSDIVAGVAALEGALAGGLLGGGRRREERGEQRGQAPFPAAENGI